MRVPERWRGFVALPERRPRAFACVGLALIATAGALLAAIVANNGTYPVGEVTLSFIYRSEELLRQIAQGAWWPRLDMAQYNGVDLLAVIPPLPVYVYAAFCALAGDGLHAFVPFCVFLFAAGAASWLWIGIRLRRGWLGLALGALWFFMPANLVALFAEGDLGRCLCLAMLPLALYQVHGALEDGRARCLLGIAGAAFAFVLCDVTFTVLVALGLLFYLVLSGIIEHAWARVLRVALAFAGGVLLAGVWLVPSLLASPSALEALELSGEDAQELFGLLNPFVRLGGDSSAVYAGLALAAVCALGLLTARRHVLPGFWTAVVLVFLASTAASPVVSLVTGGANVGIARVLGIAAAAAFLALLLWRSLKTGLVVLTCLLLVLDAVPSWNLVCGTSNRSDAAERLASHADGALISEAKRICSQRLSLVGEDLYDQETAYLIAGMGERASIAQGFSDTRTVTQHNTDQINRALESGSFAYVFDRSFELGCDTVLVSTETIGDPAESAATALDAAASKVGYDLVDSVDGYRLYHMDAPAAFGVKSSYEAAAIGTGAAGIALQFPAFEELGDTVLDHYTFDELRKYQVIYLDGFTYESRSSAENLVERLSEAGVEIVICADGMPVEEQTGERVFLGLDCEEIAFHGGFPTIYCADGALDTTLFPPSDTEWNTVYVNDLTDVTASIEEGGRYLPVCGTVKNSNIRVIGLNLTYYESLTGDQAVERLLERAIDLPSSELPKREAVGLKVSTEDSTVTVESGTDGVNIGVACLDSMRAKEGAIAAQENLVTVGKGKTVIELTYPHAGLGLLATCLGALLTWLSLAKVDFLGRG